MKKFLILMSSCFWLSVSSAQLSCYDLADLTVSLEDLSDVLMDVEEFGVDSTLDQTLGELTIALNDVAAVEQDVRLTRWIEDLKRAWHNMDRNAFEISLDNIAGRLDQIGLRDCNG